MALENVSIEKGDLRSEFGAAVKVTSTDVTCHLVEETSFCLDPNIPLQKYSERSGIMTALDVFQCSCPCLFGSIIHVLEQSI
ncbi:hypothetical protein NDU88_012100 [Pleurodeles waltl]|uniref:Uncharacterized protein n=1 Tax=Pleurodeles waltl TaxID=8319 RepID=A0AAV7QZQ0_PLEWA|nr:hypothetical protein NDU88_012100 [Pleurodeles waltl]